MSFNNSFTSALPQGVRIYNDYLANERAAAELKMRQDEAAQRATEFGWRSEDRAREAAKRAELDDAFAEINNPMHQAYKLGGTGGQTGLKLPAQNAPAQVGLRAPVVTDGEVGLGSAPAPEAGMRAQAAPVDTMKPGMRYANSEVDTERLLGKVAGLKQDVAGIRTSRENIKALEENELIGKAEFKDDDVRWLNKNHPRLTAKPMLDSKGKPNGYRITDVSHDGEATDFNISPADAKKLAGALAIMERNPTRALTIIDGIDKNLAAIVAAENGLIDKSVTSGNAAQHYANSDANAAATLGLRAKALATDEKRASAANWALVGASEDNKGLLQFNRETGQTRVMPLPAGTDATGLFARLTGNRSGATRPDQEIKPEGTLMRRADGSVYKVGPTGEEFDPRAPNPMERDRLITGAGLPAGASERIVWGADGRTVLFDNMVYDATDPRDMAELKKNMSISASNEIAAAEMQKRGGYTPRRQPASHVGDIGPRAGIVRQPYDTPMAPLELPYSRRLGNQQ